MSNIERRYGIAGRAAGEAVLEHVRDGARLRPASDAFLLSRIARAVVDALDADDKGAVSRADRLQHIIDCADTPLMRDVMKERDEARAQLRGAVDALCYFAVDESAFETQDSVAVSITKEHAAKLRALVRGAARSFPSTGADTVSAERIAICQHPNGEGVWWATDEAEPTCVQECDCTPVVYVRALVQDA